MMHCSFAVLKVMNKTQNKVRSHVQWKVSHEQFFQKFGEVWPPSVLHLDDSLLPREKELVVAADFTFPGTAGPEWQWLDANHSIERTFGWKPGQEIEGKRDIKNPWKPYVPTITCSSTIVGRRVELEHEDGTTFKVLNALEGFAMKGWTMDMWEKLPFESNQLR